MTLDDYYNRIEREILAHVKRSITCKARAENAPTNSMQWRKLAKAERTFAETLLREYQLIIQEAERSAGL